MSTVDALFPSDAAYDRLLLENQLCFPLYACAKEVVRRYREPLEPLGLTYTQYLVMMVLWQDGSLCEREVGQRLHLDSGTLAPLLKRLEKQGYIRRARTPGNERRLLVSLTEAGQALKDKALSVPETMGRCIALPREELVQLKGLLEKTLNQLERGRDGQNL